jgi:hypothetical protein
MATDTKMTDTVLRVEGMRKLNEWFGLVNAERFISLIIREPFDYTEWQQDLYEDMSIAEICQKADELWKKTHPSAV